MYQSYPILQDFLFQADNAMYDKRSSLNEVHNLNICDQQFPLEVETECDAMTMMIIILLVLMQLLGLMVIHLSKCRQCQDGTAHCTNA